MANSKEAHKVREDFEKWVLKYMGNTYPGVFAWAAWQAAWQAALQSVSPKIQGLVALDARKSIQLQIIRDLLTNPEYEYDCGMDADYTTPLTDMVFELVKKIRVAPPAQDKEQQQ